MLCLVVLYRTSIYASTRLLISNIILLSPHNRHRSSVSPFSLGHSSVLSSNTAAQCRCSSSIVIFQHRHLPLNWITLYRFVALCPILLYCLVHSETGVHNAKDQVSMCADVLEAFPERWIDAKRSALVFRHLASITSSSPSSSKPFCLFHKIVGSLYRIKSKYPQSPR